MVTVMEESAFPSFLTLFLPSIGESIPTLTLSLEIITTKIFFLSQECFWAEYFELNVECLVSLLALRSLPEQSRAENSTALCAAQPLGEHGAETHCMDYHATLPGAQRAFTSVIVMHTLKTQLFRTCRIHLDGIKHSLYKCGS